MKIKTIKQIIFVMLFSMFLMACGASEENQEAVLQNGEENILVEEEENNFIDVESIPEYCGEPYVVLNNNIPSFSNEEKHMSAGTEVYAELDTLGRCGICIAVVGEETMPAEERGAIGQIKPSGWHTVKYPNVIEDLYLYNRCHLIGFQLTGENANERNLITGTRYLNVKGMLPFENAVAEYIEQTGNHVLYKVTPVYREKNLLAHGVIMEAFSLEDHGAGIKFNVFCYNVQPGITIDYQTGESQETKSQDTIEIKDSTKEYVLNKNTKKYHLPECNSVIDMKEKNKKAYQGSTDELESMGYEPCGNCCRMEEK